MNYLIQKSSDVENNNNSNNDNKNNNIELMTQLDLWIKFLITIQKANRLNILPTIDYTQFVTTLKLLEQTLYKLSEIELSEHLKGIKNIKHDDTTLLIKIEDQVISVISIIHKTLHMINKIYTIYSIDYVKEKVKNNNDNINNDFNYNIVLINFFLLF